MNLEKMFQLQYALDKRIEKEHGLEHEQLFDKKLLALLVEVGELANETRCFKFWSEKPASPKEVVLEEYVDGVHFILSLGIVMGFNENSPALSVDNLTTGDATAKFLEVYEKINWFWKTKAAKDYWLLAAAFIELGLVLGFSEEEIFTAYVSKNEVNHQRQNDGY